MKKILNKLLILIFITMISMSNVSAASRYSGMIVADPQTFMTSYQVMFQDNDMNNAIEKKWCNAFGMDLCRETGGAGGAAISKDPAGKEGWIWRWPNLAYSSETDETASQIDFNQADRILSLASEQLNEIVGYIDQWSRSGIINITSNSEEENFIKLTILYNGIADLIEKGEHTFYVANSDGTMDEGSRFTSEIIQAGDKDTAVDKLLKRANAPNSPIKGLKESDLVRIKAPDADGNRGIVVIRSIPMGYYLEDDEASSGGQQLYNLGKKEDGIALGPTPEGKLQLDDAARIVARNSKHNYTLKDFYVSSSIEENMNEMFGSWTVGILDFLGFDNPTDLVYNEGSRGTLYYLGMMPHNWFIVANQFFWISEIIAALVLMISIINMVLKQNLATVSPTIRNSIKDSIAQMVISVLLLIVYVPIFYILAKLNFMIVDLMSSYIESFSFSTGGLGSAHYLLRVILVTVNMALIIKLNLDYFIRAVMITILHAIAPVAITSMSIQTSKQFFNAWLRELVGSIFMQSFNAIILTIVFTTIGSGVAAHWWYVQAALFAVSSLNSWFRSMLGLGDSISQMAGDVHNQGKNAAHEGVKNIKRGAMVVAGAAAVGAGVASAGAAAGAEGAVGKAAAGAAESGATSGGSTGGAIKDIGGSGNNKTIIGEGKSGNVNSGNGKNGNKHKGENAKTRTIKPEINNKKEEENKTSPTQTSIDVNPTNETVRTDDEKSGNIKEQIPDNQTHKDVEQKSEETQKLTTEVEEKNNTYQKTSDVSNTPIKPIHDQRYKSSRYAAASAAAKKSAVEINKEIEGMKESKQKTQLEKTANQFRKAGTLYNIASKAEGFKEKSLVATKTLARDVASGNSSLFGATVAVGTSVSEDGSRKASLNDKYYAQVAEQQEQEAKKKKEKENNKPIDFTKGVAQVKEEKEETAQDAKTLQRILEGNEGKSGDGDGGEGLPI